MTQPKCKKFMEKGHHCLICDYEQEEYNIINEE